MDFLRNNLDIASSPYLRQHESNPVWWQEWTPKTLEYARKEGKPLLVSVGYSTCHWCHVMAQEAFSDTKCAEILNRDFVSIKVDREQRPDIDQYLMSFLVASTGSGGWPLNAFLSPDGHPFFAMTYASTEERFQAPSFSDILGQVRSFFDEKKDEIKPFREEAAESESEPPTNGSGASEGASGTVGPSTVQATAEPGVTIDSDGDELAAAARDLSRRFDRGFGGFGSSQKFPPHSTLLFMLYAAEGARLTDGSRTDGGVQMLAMATETLSAMMTRGLHDHLQGGFFRYCVDRNWTIPHFEKMLYDQAMLLWNYSLAARLTGETGYRSTAEGIFKSLEETFRIGTLYASAHDADTNHKEGETYLWTLREIAETLNESERKAFLRVYDASEAGNFEGSNHLIRRLAPGYYSDPSVPRHRKPDQDAVRLAEKKLLAARRTRPQPFRDEKLLTGWNALAGCGLAAAHRYIALPNALERALEIADALVERFSADHGLAHAVTDGDNVGDGAEEGQKHEFLGDYATLLLLLEMLSEQTTQFQSAIEALTTAMIQFRRGERWIESDNSDFRPIPAQAFDQPVPSSVALAQDVLLRGEVAGHKEYAAQPLTDPLAHGFANVSALMSRGYFYVVESPDAVPWDRLPPNTIQIRGENLVSCYRGLCYLGLPSVKM